VKLLRFLVLSIAVSTLPAFLVQAYGQQEVDPDHFDQATAKASTSSKAPANHEVASARHQHSHAKLASKHSSGRPHHHQGRASA
jgi:hypothetical protein